MKQDPDQDEEASGRPTGPGRGRRLLFALLPLALLLVLVEIALWLAGVGDPDDRQISLSRGFDSSARYLVPDPEIAGGWRTQMYDGTRPEVFIPPRDDRTRVVLFGGSNTEGFPTDRLEQFLNAGSAGPAGPADAAGLAGASSGYEVVNLGRQGYGSERVSILLAQAMVLEPDVVVIYAGHNEFRERAFRSELETGWSLPWVQAGAEALGRLRTMNLLTSVLRPGGAPAEPIPATPSSATGVPEPRQYMRDAWFQKMDYDDTLLYYEAYRRNLRRMCMVAQEAGARVLLCTVIGNMLTPPINATLPHSLDARTREELMRRMAGAHRRIPELIRAALPLGNDIRVKDWGMPIGEAEKRKRRAANAGRPAPDPLRRLDGPLGETPATKGPRAASAAGAHWPEPALWLPNVQAVVEAVAEIHAPTLTEGERADLQRASEILDEVLAVDDDNPQAWFDLGVCTLLLGEDRDRAVNQLREASRLDRAPRRGNDATNSIVIEVGGELGGVELFDAAGLFAQRCPDGLVGYEVMMDTCHLQPGARLVLMHDLARVISALDGDS